MPPGQIAAFAILALGGYWALTGRNPLSELGLISDANAQGLIPSRTGTIPTTAQPVNIGAAIGAATSIGGSLAGAAGTAGLAGSTLALTAGIAGGAILLSWAIVSKGLFRGGEEALHVNPARDNYLNQFLAWPAMPAIGYQGGAAYGNRDAALGQLILRLNMTPLIASGASEASAWQQSESVRVRLQEPLYQADTKNEFDAATAQLETWLRSRGIVVQSVEYA